MTHGVWAALPGFSAFTLAACVALPLLALVSAAWRAHARRALEQQQHHQHQHPRPGAACGPRSLSSSRRWPLLHCPLSALLLLLALWLAVVAAVTGVWAAGGLVMDRASLDGAVTLEDVDPAVRELIRSASRGAIDPAKTGFFVEVGPSYPGAPPPRSVDIGKTTCGLFCFVMARALMADRLECTCDATRLVAVHRIAGEAWRRRLAPAAVSALVAVAGVALLLLDAGARWGASGAERRMLGGSHGEGGGGGGAGAFRRGGRLPTKSSEAGGLSEAPSMAALNVDPSSSPTKAAAAANATVDILGDARCGGGGAADQDGVLDGDAMAVAATARRR